MAARCRTKVVHTLARAMQELGADGALQFRGVGRSEGSYDGGAGELEDALAACAWARSRWNCTALWLAGFSFGSAVALQAAGIVAPQKIVTVAPPVGRMIVTPIERPRCPWLVVQGDRDELVRFDDVQSWVAGYAIRRSCRSLRGAEHFFHGRLVELRAGVKRFLGGAVVAEV
jgi:alpha/beta superfamily hydrolase